mmetsp:Transcript_8580/g.22571  ORF Transcript_8580/g.22571 Transcript_8580/m.22571 type:complete len:287 (+) Transcript_8580:66-926(+)
MLLARRATAGAATFGVGRLPAFSALAGARALSAITPVFDRKSNAEALFKPVRGREAGSEDTWMYFKSGSIATRELGGEFYQPYISEVANAKRKHAGGWEFVFVQFEPIKGEEWRDVVLDGAESGAQVSDHGRFMDAQGRVKGVPEWATGSGAKPWRVRINYKLHSFARLVCTAFHGPPPTAEHTQVRRKDLAHANSLPINLTWAVPRTSATRSIKIPIKKIPIAARAPARNPEASHPQPARSSSATAPDLAFASQPSTGEHQMNHEDLTPFEWLSPSDAGDRHTGS